MWPSWSNVKSSHLLACNNEVLNNALQATYQKQRFLKWIDSHFGGIVVSLDGTTITLGLGNDQNARIPGAWCKILVERVIKLVSKYTGDAFWEDLFILGLRYSWMLEGSQLAQSCPSGYVECFASPLNNSSPQYFSAGEGEEVFGSLGSFWDSKPWNTSTVRWYMNPP